MGQKGELKLSFFEWTKAGKYGMLKRSTGGQRIWQMRKHVV